MENTVSISEWLSMDLIIFIMKYGLKLWNLIHFLYFSCEEIQGGANSDSQKTFESEYIQTKKSIEDLCFENYW